jgi:molybdate transport system ATP-binding protein
MSSPLQPPAPIWDVALRKHLRQGSTRFELDVRFVSHARRLVLFGPSGVGKTQTLRLMAGISRPDQGRLVIAGRTLYDSASGLWTPPRERRLGFVFQDYALFPHLTVRQNIGSARHPGWLNPAHKMADDTVDGWIKDFGLGACEGLLPHQLSGGQRQRTALARALASEPQALLLDEPFAAMDHKLKARLRDELLELQSRWACPMLLITHEPEDVDLLADEVVHLDAGRVVGLSPRLLPGQAQGGV